MCNIYIYYIYICFKIRSSVLLRHVQVFSNNLNETWRQRQMQKNSPFLSAACIFLVWYWGAPRVQYKTWYSRKGTSVFSNIVNKNTAFQSIDSSKNTPMKNIWTDRTHLFSRALTHCVISTLKCSRNRACFASVVVFRFLLRFTKEHLLLIYYYSVLDLKQTLRKYVFPSTQEKSVRTQYTDAKYRLLFQVSYDRNQQVSSTKFS